MPSKPKKTVKKVTRARIPAGSPQPSTSQLYRQLLNTLGAKTQKEAMEKIAEGHGAVIKNEHLHEELRTLKKELGVANLAVDAARAALADRTGPEPSPETGHVDAETTREVPFATIPLGETPSRVMSKMGFFNFNDGSRRYGILLARSSVAADLSAGEDGRPYQQDEFDAGVEQLVFLEVKGPTAHLRAELREASEMVAERARRRSKPL